MIKNINIAITNKCNLKCIMCEIWKEKKQIDISLSNIKKIFQSRFLDKNLNITLTGGEPFLHEKLPEITEIILKNNKHSLKTISTNGALTEDILKYLNRFQTLLPKDFSLHISLDGINIHDKQRGKSLKNILRTIKLIKKRYPFINIKIKFTITPLNYSDLIPTYEFCKENNIDFRLKLVEYIKNYTNKYENKEFKFTNLSKRKITKDLLKIYREKVKFDKKNAEFIKRTIEKLFNKYDGIYCKVPFERIFVMSNGNVYSCLYYDKIGNLNEEILDNIWTSEKVELIKNDVIYKKCNKCVSYHGFSS